MTKNLLVLSLALMLSVSPSMALASTSAEVNIDDVNVGCGEQEISFSGSAQGQQIMDHLQVLLDGQEIYHEHDIDSNSPQDWQTGSVTVDEGDHTVTAIVWDQEDGDDGFRGEEAVHTIEFTVDPCDKDNGDDGDDGDQGPGGDCCPGPDPVVESVGGGEVLGAVTTPTPTSTPSPEPLRVPATGASALVNLLLAGAGTTLAVLGRKFRA